VLLVIPLATVLSIRGSHRSPAPAASHPSGTHPSSTTTNSPPDGLLGDVEWSSPVLQIDGRTMTVAVDVNRTPHYCLDYGQPDLRGVTSENSTTVTITVRAYPPSNPLPMPTPAPGTVLGCSEIGHPPVPLSVKLSQPLGDRALIDGTTGTRYSVLKASTLPAPSYLPAGYVDKGVQWYDHVPPFQVVHAYLNGLEGLRLIRSQGLLTAPGERVLTTGTVLGHPAKVAESNSYGTCAAWSDPAYSWSLCSTGILPLSAGELLRIANSIR
jgi:hypothetical protein